MATIKALLRTNKKKLDGTCPLAIRVTQNRKSTFIFLGHYLEEEHWDSDQNRVKKSHPNSKRLNHRLMAKMSEISAQILDLESKGESFSNRKLKDAIHQTRKDSFFLFSDEYLEDLAANDRYSVMLADRPRVNRFREFLKNQDVSFQDIDETMIRKFVTWLKSTRKIGERTIMNHLVVIRTIYNRAISEGVCNRSIYPFGKNGVQIKMPQSIKLGLNAPELKNLESLGLEFGDAEWHAKNIFLFSFYLAGMRVSDVLRVKWSNLQNGRLHYKMGKNQKPGSVKLTSKVLAIIENYVVWKENADDYVFPYLKKANPNSAEDLDRKIRNATHVINKHLGRIAKKANIEKKLTTHIARHTFGNLSGDKIPVQMLQKLYRHSHITTTIGYQSNFIFQDADDALEKVVEG